VGNEIANREPLQNGQITERNATAIALIRQGRVIETIANHPAAGLKGRTDQPGDVFAPCRVEQQRLTDGIPAFGFTLDEELAKRFSARGAAGFTCRLCGNSGALQRRDKELRLGGLAGPLPALEGNEISARAQCRLPQMR
jgi:hypothetical protein